MANTKAELERIQQQKKKLAAEQGKLEKQERKLQEDLVSAAFDGLIGSLKELLPGMSPTQRGRIRSLLGRFGLPVKAQRKGSAKASGGTIPPKYRLPNGATWTGRGSPPKTFREWEAMPEGKAWRKKHPDARAWPLAPGAAPAKQRNRGQAAKKSPAKKAAAKRPVKKAAAKKSARKGAKRAAK